ncbi:MULTISPECIES: OmpH family outer membrane protein [unclassified Paraflavitalea]|uniref:OmpH family outer membrane protein n=1 Tax=unclassified Paraflavitalea TaxID=2798305 RepID=UPI003D33701C
MKRIFTVAVLALGLLAASSASAQTKIGYISSQELISLMPETKKADSSLQQLRAALIQNAQDKEAKLNADIEQFNRDSAKYSEAVKTVKRAELQKAYQELAGEEQRIQEQLQNEQQRLLAPIQKKANDAVQSAAKENGFSYVFEREVLIVAPPAEDLLPLVAKKLGIKLPSQTPANNPTPTAPNGGAAKPQTKQ